MYQGKSINADFQTAMEDLFYNYGVDVYFSGHVHSYERDYPVRGGGMIPCLAIAANVCVCRCTRARWTPVAMKTQPRPLTS